MGNFLSSYGADPSFVDLVSYSSHIQDCFEDPRSNTSPALSVADGTESSFPLPPRTTFFLSEAGFARIYAGAAPIAPLRDRDVAVLQDWFKPENMTEIEADILQNLILRFPEPCWEDTIFDFLNEFL